MTCEEMSNAFDTMLNSYNVPAAFGEGGNKTLSINLNEYEKSLFLTQAQEDYVIAIYNGDATSEGFESTEEIRRYLSNLVRESILSPIKNSVQIPLGLGTDASYFTLPGDTWFITYEAVTTEKNACKELDTLDVFPVTQDDFNKTKRNPFRGPNDRRALRLDLADGVIEIVCKYPVKTYYVRYLKRPRPIILTDLPDGLTINDESKESDYTVGDKLHQACELHDGAQERILSLAVARAVQSKTLMNTRINDSARNNNS